MQEKYDLESDCIEIITNITTNLNNIHQFDKFHIAERAIEKGLPEWKKMPFCKNGGLNFKNWRLVKIKPELIKKSLICRVCIKRLESRNIFFDWQKDS